MIVQIAVPTPLRQVFDYRWSGADYPSAGQRVLVPFGRRRVIGIVLGHSSDSKLPAARLKAVESVLDREPLLPAELLKLLGWASDYYHHPIGEVLQTALPVRLRRPQPVVRQHREVFFAVRDGVLAHAGRAPLQRRLLDALRSAGEAGLDSAALAVYGAGWRNGMRGLIDKGLVRCRRVTTVPMNHATDPHHELLDEQQAAVQALVAGLGSFSPFLLQGVTGSGKTEVYLQVLDAALRQGRQGLVLVPEIALTPQLMEHFLRRLDGCLVGMHSALSDGERLQSWLLAATGEADVVIGTRSAVLVPLPRLGVVVVDEEHDTSLKQRDGFRYHARDLALMRARDAGCPVVLGSATPSFESLHNAASGRYTSLRLEQRTGGGHPPRLALLDIRRRVLVEGLSDRLLLAIERHLEADGQALVFINRRGFSPTLLCNDCGAAADCRRCDAHMTVHKRRMELCCHHCGAFRALPEACEACGSTALDRLGYGTERIADALAERFPGVELARIDRDSTRRKGALEAQLQAAISGRARLLVGTQMLAKGHHFPDLTLVGVLDADRGLYGTDFRSLEHMGQLIVQVAGRAGRASDTGEVLIQTRNPDNPMLRTLVQQGYRAFADLVLEERRITALPPYSYMALLRAEAVSPDTALAFLGTVAKRLAGEAQGELQVCGPAPAPMERLGGRYRAQLLLQAPQRSAINASLSRLTHWIGELEGARRTRWSIDVDPVDLY